MTLRIKFSSFIMFVAIVVNVAIFSICPASAHEAILTVHYDDCQGVLNGDGINEMWYILEDNDRTYHLSHEVSTIKYYFADKHFENDCTWTPEGKSTTIGEEIKAAYANSMKKWNNVYFYSYNNDGSITKNKIINIIEGTATDHNLVIYPTTNDDGTIATTGTWLYDEDLVSDPADSSHYHCPYWIMIVNIDYFYENESDTLEITNEIANFVRERNGAHELGHMLGLLDVDYEQICESTLAQDHHFELLMGYGEELLDRASNITYKDIAGVAITRGFHTDDDHKWLRMGQSDGTYKYVCSICNGIPNDSNFTPSSYDTYGRCGGLHSLSRGNMMAVASYENKDYYKCKYCRYVESFANIPTQNYKKCYYSSELHKCVNTVDGLEYFYYEPHTFVDGECTECTPHRYDYCVYLNQLSHQLFCACGETGGTGRHYVTGGNGDDWVPCAGCGYLLDMRHDIHEGIMSITQVSVNGSYIRSDGIVVLVDEDIEAYLAGTLQFYHPEDVPVTQ